MKSAKIHPLELVALASLIACCFLSIGAGLSFYWPDGHSSAFATEHYVIPLLAALGLAAWSRTRGAASLRSAGSIWWGCLRPTMAFTIVVFLHFNLKLWAQLVNPRRWDEAFLRSDAALEPLARAITWLHEPWLVLTEIWPLAYHDIFVLMFMSSLALHSVQKDQHLVLTQLVTCIALVLVIGGFSYALVPAWGPFVYGDGSNPSATAIQAHMSEFQGRFVESGGQDYQGSNFIMAVAAMPSLHTAHAYVLWLYAWRHIRWLGILYLPIYIFIITEAIVAKWHYMIDIAFGLLIALLSIRLARLLCRGQGHSGFGRAVAEP